MKNPFPDLRTRLRAALPVFCAVLYVGVVGVVAVHVQGKSYQRMVRPNQSYPPVAANLAPRLEPGLITVIHPVATPAATIAPVQVSAPASVTAITPVPAIVPRPVPVTVLGNVQAHILMYHYIRVVDPGVDPLGYGLSITAPALREQLAMLNRLGYVPLSMADYAAGKGGPKSVVLTFDDGYEDFYTDAFPILKEAGWTATAYVVSHKIGNLYMTWDQVREVKAAGFEIGAHTVDHIDLAAASPAQAKYQIEQSKRDIEAQIGVPVTAFCYPSGKYDADVESQVRQAGFLTATTTQPGTDRYGEDQLALPRVRISPSLSLPALQSALER